ncbi:MAG: Type 1 glutamine amidotransferase-like domain-containing protein [Ignavibacteriae bacterium]|nr:Type 1 glutamine amidotransferase-like domain-containing protein [Ignavibacteriota bacterium]
MLTKTNIFSTIFFSLFLTTTIFSQGYICAVGGGSEDYNDWSDAPYSWIVNKAGNGKIIILGAGDATNWLPNYFISFGADTAFNKNISSKAIANLQTTYDEIISAKAIFLRGGDQWDYVRLWKGTKVDSAINYVFRNGGVIAGTSAGAAVLGSVDFNAKNGTVYPEESLRNPFNKYMQFENNFLNFIPNVIFDTHFIERSRPGRLISMLFNWFTSTGEHLIGAGIDDRTAICISPEGIGEVMGSGAVYIYQKGKLTNYTDYKNGKYTIENLKSDILTNGWKFDFNLKEISFIPNSAKDFVTTDLLEFPKTDIALSGIKNISSQASYLTKFLNNGESKNVLIITHKGTEDNLKIISEYLNLNNYAFEVLEMSNSILNNQMEVEKVKNSTNFIFLGDSLNLLSNFDEMGSLIGEAFQSSINNGKPILFFGNSQKIIGEKFIDNTDSDLYASYRGQMRIGNGLNIFGDLIIQPNIFADSDYYENRTSSVLWGMMRNRKRFGIYLNSNDFLHLSHSNKSVSGIVETPYLLVDASQTTKVDSSIYRANKSIDTRQIVAMNNLSISLTNYSEINYSFETQKFDNLTAVKSDDENNIADFFSLYQNYPNPFNPLTIIKYTISNVVEPKFALKTKLEVFDILGKKVATLVNETKAPGTYEVKFDASKLASGIYFYTLISGNTKLIKKMLLLK